jgi:hypothetical protein
MTKEWSMLQKSLQAVEVTCTETGRVAVADVLSRGDRALRVVVRGSRLPFTLRRDRPGRAFVGYAAGLEFTCREP